MDCGNGGGAFVISEVVWERVDLGGLEYEGEVAVGVGGSDGVSRGLGGCHSMYGAGVVCGADCETGGGVWGRCEWSFLLLPSGGTTCKPLRVRLAPEEGGRQETEEAEGEERRDGRGWVEIGMTDVLTISADGQLRRLLLGRARVSAAAMAGVETVWAVIPVVVVKRGRAAVGEISGKSSVGAKG